MAQYTREELDVIVKNYGIVPIREWANQLPRRTWRSIQAKASRMGLTSEIRGPAPRFKRPPDITGETLDQVWESAFAHQKSAKALSTRQDEVNVYIDVDHPIALAFIADLHIGAVTVSLDHVRDRFRRMSEVDWLYAVSAGDTIDNYLPQRHPQGMFSTLFPPELQKELVMNIYQMLYGRWVALLQGCHEEFSHMTDDFDFTKYAARQLNCPNMGFGGLLKLHVGDQEYKIAIRHKYRYSSTLNPTHTCKRLVQMEYPEADIACVAHHHRAAVLQLSHRDKDRVYIRPGSMKGPDRYARGLGFTDSGDQIPVVILSHDKRQMLPFFSLDQAIDVIKAMEVNG